MEALIPDKLFFKIGEVAELTCLKPSVLRYWESEFSSLQPCKSPSGQRLYSRKDLETIIEIKQLLYQEKLTINGARKRLSSKQIPNDGFAASDEALLKKLRELLTELRSIKETL